MAPTVRAHRRAHSLLLMERLFNLRDSASPFTLILDTLEQSGQPVLREFCYRAKVAKTKVIFVKFGIADGPSDVDVVVETPFKSLEAVRAEIVSHYPRPGSASSSAKAAPSQKVLVAIDTLQKVARVETAAISAFVSSLLVGQGPSTVVSVVAVYRTSIPAIRPRATSSSSQYDPPPLTLLCYLATAILTVVSMHQAVERQRARNRSLPEPKFGRDEGIEGVLMGINPQRSQGRNIEILLEMELRRRSGRAVTEKFVFVEGYRDPKTNAGLGRLSLLSDHPEFAPPSGGPGGGGGDVDAAAGSEGFGGEMETTFSLGLTDKQRRDREGIVLPYFDAQTDIGGGEGGRILYDMGREDDFDDEEDEI